MSGRPHFAAFIDAGFPKAAGRTNLGLPHDAPVNAAAVVHWLRQLGDGSDGDGRMVDLVDHLLIRSDWYDGAFPVGSDEHAGQSAYRAAVEATVGVHARWG
ncbi:MAG TPA: hypothetical protein PKE32_05775 [Miltoncostaeaceae bacterium]|nr:hypothetical protein [Miltoncostaeaceae bacterium]